MTRWRTLWGLVEAASLIGLAAFIVYLLVAGNYWMYLNPKFKVLSWAAAGAFCGLGVYSVARPPAGATWLRASAFVLVLALCLSSELGVRKWLANAGVDSQALEETQSAPPPSRVTKSNVEYVRINLGELFDIAGKSLQDKVALNYAMRGFVRRTPESDAKGEFVLYRVALYCCFADTTAVGFRVRAPKGGLPEDGSWQVVYGRLEASRDPSADSVASLGGSVFASVQPDYLIDARRIEADKAPGMGMMYEWRSQEPYAY
jgi:uncharacterized repeat protein (TIGR03943 family)